MNSHFTRILYAEFFGFLCCCPQQTDEQKIELSVIWDNMMLFWHNWNALRFWYHRSQNNDTNNHRTIDFHVFCFSIWNVPWIKEISKWHIRYSFFFIILIPLIKRTMKKSHNSELNDYGIHARVFICPSMLLKQKLLNMKHFIYHYH